MSRIKPSRARISIPEKNVSLQLSQHPLKILNGCNIYRTSALLVIMKKGKEETKTWKNFWAAKQINAPTCRIITKKLLDLSKLFWSRKLCFWPLYDRDPFYDFNDFFSSVKKSRNWAVNFVGVGRIVKTNELCNLSAIRDMNSKLKMVILAYELWI